MRLLRKLKKSRLKVPKKPGRVKKWLKKDEKYFGPFFVQRRIGRNGKPFFLIKFRTLKKSYLGKNITTPKKALVNGKITVNGTTKLGKLMRKFWVDESPNLINYVFRHLKSIGIRPLLLHEYNLLNPDLQRYYKKYGPAAWDASIADNPRTWEERVATWLKYYRELDKAKSVKERTKIRWEYFRAGLKAIKKGRRGT